jgi:hypothetical protein
MVNPPFGKSTGNVFVLCFFICEGGGKPKKKHGALGGAVAITGYLSVDLGGISIPTYVVVFFIASVSTYCNLT